VESGYRKVGLEGGQAESLNTNKWKIKVSKYMFLSCRTNKLSKSAEYLTFLQEKNISILEKRRSLFYFLLQKLTLSN